MFKRKKEGKKRGVSQWKGGQKMRKKREGRGRSKGSLEEFDNHPRQRGIRVNCIGSYEG